MKAITGTAAALRPTQAALRKAYGLPQRGSHVGAGVHVDMPAAWDGVGPCPPGWTSEAVAVHVGETDAALPLPDDVAAYAQSAAAQARLTAGEKTLVANAIAQRTEKDLRNYTPERNGK